MITALPPGLRKRVAMLVLAAVAAALSACTGTTVSAGSDAAVRVAAPEVKADFARRLSAARAEARDCGGERFPAAGEVTWNAMLAEAAGRHSAYLAATGRLSHTGRGGSTLEERIRATGYAPGAGAENVASGQRTADAVIETWLDSPGHCRNIMNPVYTQVGVAAVRGGDGRLYWTLVLAAPQS